MNLAREPPKYFSDSKWKNDSLNFIQLKKYNQVKINNVIN